MASAAAVHITPSTLPRRNFSQRLAVLNPSSIPSRGKRFLARQMPSDVDGQSATLADLAKLPDWIMLEDEQIQKAALVASLLHFRRQIDKIVDGEQIRQICGIFGEEYFDMVCEAPIPAEAMLADAEAIIPPPEQLREFGKCLLTRGLPTVMAARFEEARGDPAFFALANNAVAMMGDLRTFGATGWIAMTYFLLPLGDRHAIATSSPVIKASERLEFESAVELLTTLNNRSADAAQALKASERAGYEAGFARGIEDAEGKLASVIVELTKRFELQSSDRRNDIADAALGATRAIIGSFDQVEVLRRLILQALDRIDTGAPMTIEVAPAMAKSLDGEFARFSNVRVEAVEDMDPLDCIFEMPSGRVLAGLELQMSALAERWGVGATSDMVEPVE